MNADADLQCLLLANTDMKQELRMRI